MGERYCTRLLAHCVLTRTIAWAIGCIRAFDCVDLLCGCPGGSSNKPKTVSVSNASAVPLQHAADVANAGLAATADRTPEGLGVASATPPARASADIESEGGGEPEMATDAYPCACPHRGCNRSFTSFIALHTHMYTHIEAHRSRTAPPTATPPIKVVGNASMLYAATTSLDTTDTPSSPPAPAGAADAPMKDDVPEYRYGSRAANTKAGRGGVANTGAAPTPARTQRRPRAHGRRTAKGTKRLGQHAEVPPTTPVSATGHVGDGVRSGSPQPVAQTRQTRHLRRKRQAGDTDACEVRMRYCVAELRALCWGVRLLLRKKLTRGR